MQPFRKYSSIENSYRKKAIEYIESMGLDKYNRVVTEKVHGANLSIRSDGESIWAASRNRVLEPHSKFYGFQDFVDMYGESVLNMANDLGQTVAVYGEIYGGFFPGEESTGPKVQGGVFYSPNTEFVAFDVRLHDSGCYMDAIAGLHILDKYRINRLDILCVDKFQKCLDFDVDFITTISSIHDMPEIENNIAEGIVMKPVVESVTPNGSRVILKKKNEKFKERVRGVKKEKPEGYDEVVHAIEGYYNVNRIDSAISKIGPASKETISELVKEVTNDVLKDYMKDYGDIDEEVKKQVIKHINKLAAKGILLLI